MREIRSALRMLLKSPDFTVVAVITLALSIGANAVVFGIMNGLILRPLNLPQEESLYSIEHGEGFSASMSYPDYLDIRDRNRSFDGLAAFYLASAGLDTGGNPSLNWVYAVSGNYFDVLGIKPHVGRFFQSSDERGPDSAPYIVLTYAYWHAYFHDAPDVIGRSVLLNKHPYTIVGVAPPGFRGTLQFFTPDFFMPLVNQGHLDGRSFLNERGNRWIFTTIGRLKAGVTPPQAITDLNSIGSYFKETYPNEVGPSKFKLGRPGLFIAGPILTAFLGVVMLMAALVLLAACANLGSLFAARAADRSREVALRLALGATRTRILSQLFTEAVLISIIGGAAGLWISDVLLRLLSRWDPVPGINVNLPVTPDGNVHAVALLLSIASGFLFGAMPVRQVLRTEPYEIVKSGSISRPGRRLTFRDVLLVMQIAVCALLVTSSLVAARGLVRSLNTDFGFEPRNAMLLETTLSMGGYFGDAVPPMQKRMIDAMQSIPGVTSAALVDWPPLTRGFYNSTNIFDDETTDLRTENRKAVPATYSVSPGYFEAAGTSMLDGRDFAWHADEAAPRVAVVNREFARTVFRSATNAVGSYFKIQDGTRTQVVGIVEDGKHQSLTEASTAAMFVPILQRPTSETSLVVRSNRDTQQLSAAIRSKTREIDSGLPVLVTPLQQKLGMVLFPSRAATLSLAVLGAMAAMLSLTGLFGMAAYTVSKRNREIGIRIAVGAARKEVLHSALSGPFKLLALGSAAGLVLGTLAANVLSFVVYQAAPGDPIVLAGAVVAMLLLGLLATWIPARRALSIDPLVLLREE